jgi:spore maturation protein CgeB
MRVVMFVHSIRSDWNHGNAHFLRGVACELQRRGHQVAALESDDGWSATNLARDAGPAALDAYREAYPTLVPTVYAGSTLDLDATLDRADLVIVHEWNPPALIARVGAHRLRAGRYALLFHDTHHRSCSQPDEIARLDLSGYDGVLAFGEVIRERYLRAGWARCVWTWHEAADTRIFSPQASPMPERRDDVIWIGNWGDDERTSELHGYLLDPAFRLGLTGHVHGVRYPAAGIDAVARSGLRFAGWLPNHRVPEAFARHRVTVHVPRRPYAEALPGIPTIRVFEALACGIPLLCAPWDDCEQLFRAGEDYLVAHDGVQMTRLLRDVLADRELSSALAASGRRTILARHTCAHRVTELLAIVDRLSGASDAEGAA